MKPLRLIPASLLLASALAVGGPATAEDQGDEVLLPTKTDDQNQPFELESVDVDLSNYDVDPLTFDLERTTFTEIEWLRQRLERDVRKATIREAFAIADLADARANRSTARSELQQSNIRLQTIAQSFSSAAVEGFLTDLSGDLDNVIAPDLQTIASNSLSNYTTEQILIDRTNAELAVEKAEGQLAVAETAVSQALTDRQAAKADVEAAEGVIERFEQRVIEHAAIDESNDDAARRLGDSFASQAPAEGQLVVNANVELTSVAGVFKVNSQIEEQLDALIAHARADGFEFGGGAYRTVESQIELRIAHCGGTEPADLEPLLEDATPEEVEARDAELSAYRRFVIYEAPAGSCSPPTAVPGQSEHQLGLAIDFTDNSGNILTWGSAHFAWLEQHAHLYGLYNLESEAWHWSTTGN